MAENFTRAFVAIDLPDDAVKEIAKAQEILSKRNFEGKMTNLGNLHLTLKFLGEITDKKIEEVRSALRQVKFNEIDVKLGRVGIFGKGGMPRIAWVKLEGEGLWKLQKDVDTALEAAGFRKEERFMSHITIARIKRVSDKKEFAEFASRIKCRPVIFTVKDFKLKKSELGRMGPRYNDLESFGATK